MLLHEADFIHQSVANYPRANHAMKNLAVSAFNAHQHIRESLKSDRAWLGSVPTTQRLNGATAELRLLWRMLPEVYQKSRLNI